MDILIFSQPATGSWLVNVIAWLIKICSSIALGVVLFTVLLKLVTLPFDFISRSSMRKNSLKMEQMRPELEKLQKQYAHDKNLYNQKMSALYKKNGYSMWGACLPTILTLVIFIVAINAFTDYSRYANKVYIYNMTNEYNNVVYAGMETDGNYIYRDEKGKLIVDANKLFNEDETKDDGVFVKTIDGSHDITFNYTLKDDSTLNTYEVYTTNSYVKYISSTTGKSYKIVDDVNDKLVESNPLATEENNFFKNSAGQTFAEYTDGKLSEENTYAVLAQSFLKDIREIKSAESFRNEDTDFLWVKNIWVTDSPMKHPIESDWNNFQKNFIGNDSSINLQEDQYQSLIAKLDKEKNEPNGYFILVALTALSSLAMQLITSKSQKAQMELQTVDGQGASTNKVMTWMMPIMMAVFAFIYTAAFSIYIVLSSVISLVTTLSINAIIDRKFKKETEEKAPTVVRGRVYTPPKQEKVDKKKEKKAKKQQEEAPDFLTGKADRKKR